LVPVTPVVSEEIFKKVYNDVGRQVMAKAHMAYKAMETN
jgi:valyl-tRNA synthetase